MVPNSLRTSSFGQKKIKREREISTVRNDPIRKRKRRQQEMLLVGLIVK